MVASMVAALFVVLGMWQLDRHEERQASNSLIELRSQQAPRPLAELQIEFGNDPDDLAHRRTVVEGTYRSSDEFFSIGRAYGSLVGSLVLTPLDLDDGSTVIVVRGVVPADTPGPPAKGFEAPTSRVVLEGRLDDGENPQRIGEPEPPTGHLESLSRVDLGFIDTWIDGDVLQFSILLDEQLPTQESAPVPVPDDELSEGSHLGYAFQWFSFAVIAIVGLVALLYRAGRVDLISEA